MWKRAIAALAGVLIGAAIITTSQASNAQAEIIPPIKPLFTTAVLAICSGFAFHYAWFERYRPISPGEAAALGTFVCAAAAIGYTAPQRALLDGEMLYLITSVGTLPVATGAAITLRIEPYRRLLIVSVILLALASALYVGGNLLFRIPVHLGIALPGVIVGIILTKTNNSSTSSVTT